MAHACNPTLEAEAGRSWSDASLGKSKKLKAKWLGVCGSSDLPLELGVRIEFSGLNLK